jgi:acyl transferase domain-containing protein/acyl carrier protein
MDTSNSFESDIAIIGMAGRFPGANTIEAFWHNVRAGVESISCFSDAELLAAGVDPAFLQNPHYVKARSVLDDIELFDAAFFGIHPREAESMDPQHRLFLECAWQALEHAGYDSETFDGLIGVYAGIDINSYLLHNLYSNRSLNDALSSPQTQFGNDKDYLPTRVSYKLNLTGPSINVNTACSTALVAAHLACQSLLNNECDLALAGGVGIILPQKSGYFYQEGGIVSPDGHCRTFDAEAQGTVRGSGVGIVVLKRLADALADGDAIYAVIKGSAINNDGALKVGYTAPSVDGQSRVITEAQAIAGVAPETISYIEAHGTATALGDPIEVAALTRAFRTGTAKTGFCAIGSVKTNVGHLGAAAGAAGLIKTILALHHQQIPPSLHFHAPNPNIDFAASPFYVNTRLTAWPRHEYPRRAGVSAFGIGGTNAHLVLEEAPHRPASAPSRPWQLLLLSAKTATALDAATAQLTAYVQQTPAVPLADLAYTLQVGRRPFPHRRMLVCRDYADALHALHDSAGGRILTRYAEPGTRVVTFMFPGQGAQYAGMAEELYQSESRFREAVDQCAALLAPELGCDIREVLYGTQDAGRRTNDEDAASSFVLRPASNAADPLDQTQYAQPALFVIEYALAQLWMSWGVQPQALIGHSIGEYVAACLAEVFTLADALALVALRGRLMQQLSPGAMLAVGLSEAEMTPLLGAQLSLAAVNGSALCVVAGPQDAVDALQARLTASDTHCRRLHTSHAFHSTMMEPLIAPFTQAVQRLRLQPPRIPFVSNATGDWIRPEAATDPRYWGRQLRMSVRFADGLATVLQASGGVLLEVGPGRTLSTLARRHSGHTSAHMIVESLRHPSDKAADAAVLLRAVGQLWLAGVALDWHSFSAHERRQRAAVPTYPFERQRYWIAPQPTLDGGARQASLGTRPDPADWFAIPSWKRSALPEPFRPDDAAARRLCWLVFTNERTLGAPMAQRLEQVGQNVIRVTIGPSFMRSGDYAALLTELREREQTPQIIVYFASANPDEYTQPESLENALSDCDQLLFLAQALGEQKRPEALQLWVIAHNVHKIESSDVVYPEKAALLGLCTVIPHEYPQIRCRHIDMRVPELGMQRAETVLDQLLGEINAQSTDTVVAYRGNHRWVQLFAAERLDRTDQRRLKEGGVYLIIGGLAGVGCVLAEYLAQAVQAKLILVGRPALPEHAENGRESAIRDVSRTLQGVQALEALGAEVVAFDADVADPEQLLTVLTRAHARFGAINGVIYASALSVAESVSRPISAIDNAEYADAIRSSLHELLVLERVLQRKELDFCLLISSLSAVLGGVGQCAVSAVSLFMAALAQQHDTPDPTPWLSVHWDVGQTAASDADRGAFALTAQDVAAVVQRLMSRDLNGPIIISPADVQARIDRLLRSETPRATDALATAESAGSYARPGLSNEYVAPRNELERALVEIWQRLFGIETVGIQDNFFALSGDSLLAIQLVAQLQAALGVELSLASVFEAPTVAGLAAHVAQIRGSEQALRMPPLAPVARDGWLPASFAQERMRVLLQLEPFLPQQHNDTIGLHLAGALDIPALEQSLNELISRQEIFRTVFAPMADGLTQIIRPPEPLTFARQDLCELPQAERDAAITDMIAAESQYRFDLDRGPLLRATLARLDEATHVLLIVFPRIISDGWSKGIILQELETLYAACATGTPAPLPEPSIQYADYAAWQRRWFQGAVLESQLAYWRAQLADAPADLALPADRPRPAVERFRSAHHFFALSPDLTDALKALSRREGSTPFITLLAAFKVLLYALSRAERMLVGVPIANRSQVGSERVIGRVGNTLLVHTDLSGDPSFRELLGRVRENVLGANQHALPYDKLLAELRPDDYLQLRAPFQAMFNYYELPVFPEGQKLPGVIHRPLNIDLARLDADLILVTAPQAEGLPCDMRYNTDLFDAATIARIAEQFQTLLEGIIENPGRRLGDLARLLGPE